MGLEKAGLNKLTEECGELIQIASKKMAYMDTDEHPDGKGSMKSRLEEEIADVIAICHVVVENFGLDTGRIRDRVNTKSILFRGWEKQLTND